MGYCASCGQAMTDGAKFCQHCGAPTIGVGVQKASESNLPRTALLAGSLLLVLACFVPVISAPFLGSINLFANGKGDGVLLAILAICGFVAALSGRYRLGYIPAALGLIECANVWYRLLVDLPKRQQELSSKLGTGLVRTMSDLTFGQIHAEWGIAVLLIGTLLCLTAAVAATRRRGLALAWTLGLILVIGVGFQVYDFVRENNLYSKTSSPPPKRTPEEERKYREGINELIRKTREANSR